jgi:hypothetical protein
MSVTEALDAWPALESTGLTLGSPAPGNYWSGWLDQFMTGAAERSYRVDFIALHIYPDKADGFLQKVIPLLENLPYVQRYAWFADNCSTTVACEHSTLYSATDQLTTHGAAFTTGKPIGPVGRFRLVNKAQPTAALHAAGET